MTLLKAIFTSRKLDLLVLLILLALSLCASPYKAAVFCEDESYKALLLDVLSALSGRVTNEDAALANRLRLEAKARFSREASISGYRTGEDEDKLSELLSAKEEKVYDGVSLLEVAPVSLTDIEMEYVAASDRDALEYVRMKYDLDMVVYARVREEGQVMFSEVWIDGEPCCQSAYLSADEDGEFSVLLEAFLPYLKSRAEVIVTLDAPGLVALTVDGNPVSPVRKTFILTRGEHLIRYSSYRYKSVEETVDVTGSTVLSPRLEPVFSGPVFISSRPFDADMFYQGEAVEDHVTANGTVPYAVSAVRDGFALSIVQSTIASDYVSLELKPAWTGEASVRESEKRRFYNSLLGTLLSFGCYVGSIALEGIYPYDTNFPVTTIAFTGLSLVQLMEMVDSMFGYYQAAKLGI